jgi:hypothetical protein
MKFGAAKRIGYNMSKGWNTQKYPEWRWNTNKKAKETYVDRNQDGDINTLFRIEISQDRTQGSYICLR